MISSHNGNGKVNTRHDYLSPFWKRISPCCVHTRFQSFMTTLEITNGRKQPWFLRRRTHICMCVCVACRLCCLSANNWTNRAYSILRIHPHRLAPVREYEAIQGKETQGYRYTVRNADSRDIWHKTEAYHADSRKKYNWGYNPVDYSTKSTHTTYFFSTNPMKTSKSTKSTH